MIMPFYIILHFVHALYHHQVSDLICGTGRMKGRRGYMEDTDITFDGISIMQISILHVCHDLEVQKRGGQRGMLERRSARGLLAAGETAPPPKHREPPSARVVRRACGVCGCLCFASVRKRPQ